MTLPSRTDSELVRLTREGDESAFVELVRRYQDMSVRVAMRVVGDWDDAMDVAQHAFVRAHARLDQLDDGSSFRGWLLQIVRNLARNFLRDAARRRQRHRLYEDERLRAAEEGGGPPPLEERERRIIREAIARLPERQREVVSLRIDGECSFGEVARLLGISEVAARVNFHHAITRLKQELPGLKSN
ncbi:MAG: ECF RNA polymerase sigma factor SigW [Myxococcota bacterium]|nr:ECF RNA polymerase sigma factor SigW [Myxococcota bacterium]